MKRAALAVVLLLAAACKKEERAPLPAPAPTLSEADRKPAQQKLETARAQAKEIDLAHRARARELFMQRPVQRADKGTCPVAAKTILPDEPAPVAETHAAKRAAQARRTSRIVKMADVYLTGGADPRGLGDPPARAALESAIEEFKPRMEGTTWRSPAELEAAVDKLVAEWAAGHDLTLTTTSYVPPRLEGATEFISGELQGTLYLFSRAERTFICRADALSVNRDEVRGMRGFMDTALDGEFVASSIEATLPNLGLLVTDPIPDAGRHERPRKGQ